MELWGTFRGGIHPPERKLTSGKPIECLPVPAKVVIPLSMHIGAPCRPLVKKGDAVWRGQLIGEPQGYVSAPVHSSISGTVTDVGDHMTPMGRPVLSVFIESDGKDQPVEQFKPVDCMSFSINQMRERIKAGGIVGLGGAAFPTHVKLNPPKGIDIDTVIINGAECEPYLTADHRLMLEQPRRIIDGARILKRVFRLERIFIAVENNKPDAIEALTDTVHVDDGIVIVPLTVKYPQGAEKQLICSITGRQVPSGGLPMNVNTLVQNVGTVAAISDAVTSGKPLYERILTVTGSGITDPKNLLVRIGTLFSDVIEYCGGFKGRVEKLLMGGPMMGIAQFTTQVPVVKGTSGILALVAEDVKRYKERSCIRCGRCVDVCPIGLIPSVLGVMVENRNFDRLEENNILDCVECGSCNFICPSKRRLVQYIRTGKAFIQAQRQKERQRREQEKEKQKV